jgi:hypothetical protein
MVQGTPAPSAGSEILVETPSVVAAVAFDANEIPLSVEIGDSTFFDIMDLQNRAVSVRIEPGGVPESDLSLIQDLVSPKQESINGSIRRESDVELVFVPVSAIVENTVGRACVLTMPAGPHSLSPRTVTIRWSEFGRVAVEGLPVGTVVVANPLSLSDLTC